MKDLSVAALIGKMIGMAGNDGDRAQLRRLLDLVRGTGAADKRVASLGLNGEPVAN